MNPEFTTKNVHIYNMTKFTMRKKLKEIYIKVSVTLKLYT
jgi:hypothetical protein